MGGDTERWRASAGTAGELPMGQDSWVLLVASGAPSEREDFVLCVEPMDPNRFFVSLLLLCSLETQPQAALTEQPEVRRKLQHSCPISKQLRGKAAGAVSPVPHALTSSVTTDPKPRQREASSAFSKAMEPSETPADGVCVKRGAVRAAPTGQQVSWLPDSLTGSSRRCSHAIVLYSSGHCSSHNHHSDPQPSSSCRSPRPP